MRIVRTPQQASTGAKNTQALRDNQNRNAILGAFSEMQRIDAELARLSMRRQELAQTVETAMTESQFETVSDGNYITLVKDVMSRGGRDIDAKRFFDLVAPQGEKQEALAWEAMSVTVKEAEKLLTSVELNKNFPMQKGKKTGTRIVIERVDVKTR
jgi:CRISPR/Cas system-associated protein Csm6